MVLQVITFLLSAMLAETAIYEGNPCILTNQSPGVCTAVSDCPVILEELVAGKVPDTLCGYTNLEPILCCPVNTPTTIAPPLPTPEKEPVDRDSWVNDHHNDHCNLSNGTPGNCTVLKECESVVQDLHAGKAPDKLCGFHGIQPIICCPSVTSGSLTTTTVLPVVQAEAEAQAEAEEAVVSHGTGIIARRKCTEYARSVYTLMYPPILHGYHLPLNASLCAIKSQNLVTGGIRAERMEFPHMAAIGYNLKTAGVGWYCSGTLISDMFVLTAAHCVNLPERGDAQWVRLGDLNLANSDDGAQPVDRQIIERIIHSGYKPPSLYHDIALLRLEYRVAFNSWIRPACLHTKASTETEKVIATGWGPVEWNNNGESSDLLKVTLPLVDQPTCNASYTSGITDFNLSSGVDGSSLICAGQEGRDTCQGDSGGPLLSYSEPKYYCMYDVVGITSLRQMCRSGIPGLYTRVYNYISWIESTVWGSHS